MNFSKRLAVALSAVTLAVVGLSAPAHAVPYGADCSTVGASMVNVTASKWVNDTFQITNNGGTSCTILATGDSGVTSWVSSNGADSPTQDPTTLSAGATLTITMVSTGSATISLYNNRLYNYHFFVATGGGGGGGPAPSSSQTTAPTETLTLAVAASGATCTGGNPSGISGSWLTLPSADQCTQSGPTAKADAKLLGWSTSANFPIALAQSQVDKHWGVIDETIDGVRMIFIPAGMAVFVSGSNNLFPVWSK